MLKALPENESFLEITFSTKDIGSRIEVKSKTITQAEKEEYMTQKYKARRAKKALVRRSKFFVVPKEPVVMPTPAEVALAEPKKTSNYILQKH